MVLKKLNLKKIEEENKKKNEKYLKFVGKDDNRKFMALKFRERFKHHFNTEYKFQEKRITQAGKKLSSDFFRLGKIFDYLMVKGKNKNFASEMLCLIIDNWSEWDKAHPLNLVGFIENQCNDDEIGKFYMKAKKGNKEKSTLHDENHRQNTVEKHRKYFDDHEDVSGDYK